MTVTNSAFPLIDDMSPEERQARAEKDELSTKEVPVFFIDNTTASSKAREFSQAQTSQYNDIKIKRDDIRIEVPFS